MNLNVYKYMSAQMYLAHPVKHKQPQTPTGNHKHPVNPKQPQAPTITIRLSMVSTI